MIVAGDVEYIQGITSLSESTVAFGTNTGQILIFEFPLAITNQPVLQRIISVGSTPVICLASDQVRLRLLQRGLEAISHVGVVSHDSA